jgi:thiol-activated cytolysin
MNFKKEMSLIISSIVVFLFVMAGCAADATDGNNVAKKSKYSAETLRMMRQLSTLEMPEGITLGTPEGISEELDTEGTLEPDVKKIGDITYITTTKKFKLSASFDTQILLDPASEVIYPGSVILGHTINNGSYTPVAAGTTKRPVTLSYDLVGVSKLSDTIVPTKSRYTELHNEIMSQYIPQQSTVYSFEQTQLRNEDEFNLKFSLGAGFGVGPVKADIKSAFNFSNGEEKSNYMIKFMQTFYTVNLDSVYYFL